MSKRPIIVLKFGSSVLCNEDCLPDAVSEIYRWYRDGNDVIAVVSAIGESTDALFAQAHRLSPDASHHHVASLVATGELTSAALLGLSLDRVGVPCDVLDHRQLGLRARGEALDEDPVSLNVVGLRERLQRVPVLVVPGFLAVDELDRTVLLGRGGSDLTAVFIAEQIGAARCRLIKDVDGVYDRDPNAAAAQPAGVDSNGAAYSGRAAIGEASGGARGDLSGGARKFKAITFERAHQLSSAILQAKATAFAERRRFAFEVAALQSDAPSVVGAAESQLLDEDEDPPKRIKVALLGLGTVGGGVAKRMLDAPWQFEITRVLVRSTDRQRDVEIDPALLTTEPADVLDGEPDVLIDCLADALRSRRLINAALQRGIDVISASKAVIAAHHDEFRHAANRSGASLQFGAAVGGAAPVLERVRRLAAQRDVRSVRGVLNGTTNFILNAIERGDDLDRAVERARRAGLSEGDATDDLNGCDAARKLSIIAQYGLGLPLDANVTPRFVSFEEPPISGSAASGKVTRQVAALTLDGRGAISEAHVRMEQLAADDPLASNAGVENTAVVTCADDSIEVITGAGAGRWPTTESIWADLWEIVRRQRRARCTVHHQAGLAEVMA